MGLPDGLKKRSIYPPDWAVAITGGSASQLNAAIMCWAHALSHAVDELDLIFNEKDWPMLLAVLRGHAIDPENPYPADSVMGTALANRDELDPIDAEHLKAQLLPKLGKLSVVQAHALQQVINTVKGYRPKPGWWKWEAVQRMLQEV